MTSISLMRAATLTAAATLLAAPAAWLAASARQAGAAAPVAPMTFARLEQRAIALGVRASELKIKTRTAEVEGRDASGRKVELTLDSRTGKVLHRDYDD